MMTRHVLSLTLLALVLWAPTPRACAETLTPEEGLTEILFTGGDTWRPYLRFARHTEAHVLVCGQGELRLLSRAMLDEGDDLARYTLRLAVDGARPARELTYRAGVADGARFRGDVRATSLRRETLRLGRGCHTLVVELARSTSMAVGVRLLWEERAPRKRRWDDLVVTGGPSEHLVVGTSRTPYQRVDADGKVRFEIEGPTWVRLLLRPTGQHETIRYALEVESDGRDHRSYLLDNTPSNRAVLDGHPGVRVGAANEVMFPVAAGRQRLTVRGSHGLDLMVRAQVASRQATGLPERTEPAWHSRARLSSYYDDNILRYSDRFVQRFEAGQDPGRFRVESLDDVIQRLDVEAERRFAGLEGREGRFSVEATHRAYLRNPIKDWTQVGLSWQQDLGLGRSLRVAARWAPGFYVRHLRDSDLRGAGSGVDPFQAFEFDRAELRSELSHRLGTSSSLRYHLGLASFRHTPAFREFDSENLFAGVRLDRRMTQLFRLSAAVELTSSDARGWDETGETRATSDDTDPSYQQLDLMVAGRWRFSGQRRPTLFLQAELGLRDYTTDKPASVAPLHVGRDDELLRFFASWQLDLSPRYRLTFFAQHRTRSSTALVDLDIGDEKDYDQTELGLRLTVRFGT